MPSKTRITINISAAFLAELSAYQQENNIKTLAATVTELAAKGLGTETKINQSWGGNRKMNTVEAMIQNRRALREDVRAPQKMGEYVWDNGSPKFEEKLNELAVKRLGVLLEPSEEDLKLLGD